MYFLYFIIMINTVVTVKRTEVHLEVGVNSSSGSLMVKEWTRFLRRFESVQFYVINPRPNRPVSTFLR